MNEREIVDYASFLKAKFALEKEIEFHLASTTDNLKSGVKNMSVVKMVSGLAEKAMESTIGQKVSEVLSIASVVKSMFGKKKEEKDDEKN